MRISFLLVTENEMLNSIHEEMKKGGGKRLGKFEYFVHIYINY